MTGRRSAASLPLVHDAGAGHGPVALTGAAAQRPGTQLHHRAGRLTRQDDGARLRRELDRRPCGRADARLHLVTNRVGYGGRDAPPVAWRCHCLCP